MAKKKGSIASPFVPAEEQPYKIPDNWCWTYGGMVLEAMESQKPIGEEFDYIDIDAIDNQKQTVNSPKRLPVSKAPSRASRKLHAGDTVFSLVRPYLKNIAYIDDSLAHCIASTGFFVCSPKAFLNSRYLYQLMISPYVVDGLNQYMKGDNSPSIRKEDIEQFPFPLPTLPEQQRIVARIESLFAKLDEAKEKAQTVVNSFELRKSAILHKAFMGELTAQWRKEHKLEMNSWVDTIFKTVMDVRDGTHDSPKYCDVGYALITSKNLKDGRIIDKDLKYISKDDYDKINVRSKVDIGDILFAMIGTIGNPVVIEDTPNYSIKNVALFKNIGKVNPYFVKYYLETKEVKDKMDKDAKGSTQRFVSLGYLRNLSIPVPTKAEQIELVELVDNLIKNEGRALEAAETVLTQIDTMKKAILARAFRGELGTNDPAEEWAGELVKAVL